VQLKNSYASQMALPDRVGDVGLKKDIAGAGQAQAAARLRAKHGSLAEDRFGPSARKIEIAPARAKGGSIDSSLLMRQIQSTNSNSIRYPAVLWQSGGEDVYDCIQNVDGKARLGFQGSTHEEISRQQFQTGYQRTFVDQA